MITFIIYKSVILIVNTTANTTAIKKVLVLFYGK